MCQTNPDWTNLCVGGRGENHSQILRGRCHLGRLDARHLVEQKRQLENILGQTVLNQVGLCVWQEGNAYIAHECIPNSEKKETRLLHATATKKNNTHLRRSTVPSEKLALQRLVQAKVELVRNHHLHADHVLARARAVGHVDKVVDVGRIDLLEFARGEEARDAEQLQIVLVELHVVELEHAIEQIDGEEERVDVLAKLEVNSDEPVDENAAHAAANCRPGEKLRRQAELCLFVCGRMLLCC